MYACVCVRAVRLGRLSGEGPDKRAHIVYRSCCARDCNSSGRRRRPIGGASGRLQWLRIRPPVSIVTSLGWGSAGHPCGAVAH